MKESRIPLTALIITMLAGMLVWDFIAHSMHTFDFMANTLLGYGLGTLLGFLWPVFAAQPRDEKGRFVKND